MRRSLTRRERVRDGSRIKFLYRARATRRRDGLRAFYAPNESDLSRVVVCPARGFGTAVARNRRRRVVREAYRSLKHRVRPGFDILVQVSPAAAERSQRSLQHTLAQLLRGASLLTSPPLVRTR